MLAATIQGLLFGNSIR